MKILSSSRLETQDLGDALQFVLTREDGLIGHIAGPVIIALLLLAAWWKGSTMFGLVGLLAIIGYGAGLARGNETLLRVSEREVMAKGNLQSWTTSEFAILTDDIRELGWTAGSEDDSGGLYVATKWRRPYLLPGITKEQAHGVIDAIAGRFPDFPIGDNARAWTLYGDSDITTLGLNKLSKSSSD